jgi:hypothetical protein
MLLVQGLLNVLGQVHVVSGPDLLDDWAQQRVKDQGQVRNTSSDNGLRNLISACRRQVRKHVQGHSLGSQHGSLFLGSLPHDPLQAKSQELGQQDQLLTCQRHFLLEAKCKHLLLGRNLVDNARAKPPHSIRAKGDWGLQGWNQQFDHQTMEMSQIFDFMSKNPAKWQWLIASASLQAHLAQLQILTGATPITKVRANDHIQEPAQGSVAVEA